MNTHFIPFEDPEKRDLRERAATALDRAGYEVRSKPLPIDVPESMGLTSRIKGDVQGVSSEEEVAALYAIPRAGEVVPKWLMSLGRAAHRLDGVSVHVVTREFDPSFESACRTSGLGLLALTDDDELRVVVDFHDAIPEDAAAEIIETEQRCRRSLDDRLRLARVEIEKRRNQIVEITATMDADTSDAYIEGIEREYKDWGEWGDDLSRDLDAALVGREKQALVEIEERIDSGLQRSSEAGVAS